MQIMSKENDMVDCKFFYDVHFNKDTGQRTDGWCSLLGKKCTKFALNSPEDDTIKKEVDLLLPSSQEVEAVMNFIEDVKNARKKRGEK